MNASTFVNHVLRSSTASRHRKPPENTNAKALTAAILNHLRFGRLSKAVSILFSSPVPFDFDLYTRLFQICGSSKTVVEARKVESHLVTFYENPPTFLMNRAIEVYGKCGCLSDARELFDEMPSRDGGSWNAMVIAYSKNGYPDKALSLFYRMHVSGVLASEITFASILGSCAAILALWFMRQVHGLIVKYGFCGNVILESSLVDGYGKCMVISEARRMFDEIHAPNDVTWNIIIRRYLEANKGKEAVVMFRKMVCTDTMPFSFTVSNTLLACSRIGGLKEGVQIHGYAIKVNLELDEIVSSSLIDMYVKCKDLESASIMCTLPSSQNVFNLTSMLSGYCMTGKIREAREIFDGISDRSIVSWNAMLAGYTRSFLWEEAFDFILLMRKETRERSQAFDHVTLGLILNICSALSDVELGKQVHAYVYRHGFYSDVLVGNALIDLYGKCGFMKYANFWFLEMVHLRDNVSWNAFLTTFGRHKLCERMMASVREMLGETTPSIYTFGTLLAACASISALAIGKQIHGFMMRNGYQMDVVIFGALVDMYSKCRCIDYALRAFEEADLKDVILWNSIILGCFQNNKIDMVYRLFELMEKEGTAPDHITFKGLLLSCASDGCIELGQHYFDLMTEKYYIIPRLEHYQSMIDLYSRHGFMDQLEQFVKKLPFEPTVPMLIRIVNSSGKHGHFRLEKWATEQLKRIRSAI